MAFPAIVARSSGEQSSDAASWPLTYPTGIQAGELLLLLAGADGNPTLSSVGGSTLTVPANAHTPVTTGWTNPSNAFAATGDDTYATVTSAKNTTRDGDFGFADITSAQIPDGATIVAVRVVCEWGMTALVTGGTLGCQPRISGANSGTEATKTTTVEEQTTATFGTVTLADLRAASTVVTARVRCTKGSTNAAMTGNLDFVRLEIDYVDPWVVFSDGDGGNVVFGIAKKIAAGTESGALSLTWSAAEQGCWRILRISPWNGTLGTSFAGGDASGGAVQLSGSFTGASTNFGFPEIDPSNWDAPEETLYLAAGAADGGDTDLTTASGTYTDEGTAQKSGGASGAALHAMYKQSSAGSSGFPSPSVTVSPSEQWVSHFLAIRGTTVAYQPRYGFVNFQEPGVL